jgi:hypothetical protein
MVKYLDDSGEVREIVEDGESIRCPVYLMDSVQRGTLAKYGRHTFDADDHRPRHAVMTDDVRKLRRESRDAYVCDLTNAWRSPAQRAAVVTDADADPVRNRSAAYDAMIKRATNAWRMGRDQQPEPDADDPDDDPMARMSRHLRTDNVQARRDAIWNDYKTRLGNAWKTNPNASSGRASSGGAADERRHSRAA